MNNPSQIVLSDHNCGGQAEAIFETLRWYTDLGWVPLELRFFQDIGISETSSDEFVWKLCQTNDYILLTGNRSMRDGDFSLEATMRRLYHPNIIPVVTIGNLKRVLKDPIYRYLCAEKLAEIALDVNVHRGTMRLFIP